MNPTVGVVMVAAALAIIAVVINQVQARLALVEVALNEGLPPGHEPTADAAVHSGQDESTRAGASLDPATVLGPGVHIFLSRTCHACQRLLDDLAERRLGLDDVSLRYVDRPRPLAHDAARTQGAPLTSEQSELAAGLAADPLPYTIAIGGHGLVARSVTPTRSLVIDTARQAGHGVNPT